MQRTLDARPTRLIVGGEERVELERVLAMHTVGQQARGGSVTNGRHDGGRRRELMVAQGTARLLGIDSSQVRSSTMNGIVWAILRFCVTIVTQLKDHEMSTLDTSPYMSERVLLQVFYRQRQPRNRSSVTTSAD
jgi:hypothetical protein